jgi:hypothetical protein
MHICAYALGLEVLNERKTATQLNINPIAIQKIKGCFLSGGGMRRSRNNVRVPNLPFK